VRGAHGALRRRRLDLLLRTDGLLGLLPSTAAAVLISATLPPLPIASPAPRHGVLAHRQK